MAQCVSSVREGHFNAGICHTVIWDAQYGKMLVKYDTVYHISTSIRDVQYGKVRVKYDMAYST